MSDFPCRANITRKNLLKKLFSILIQSGHFFKAKGRQNTTQHNLKEIY